VGVLVATNSSTVNWVATFFRVEQKKIVKRMIACVTVLYRCQDMLLSGEKKK